jgi:hypothetical protein
MADDYAKAKRILKKTAGQQLDLPLDLPKMASVTKEAVTVPKVNAGPAAPVQNGQPSSQVQPPQPPAQPPAYQNMQPWNQNQQAASQPDFSKMGATPQDFPAPPPKEGLLGGTAMHLAGGVATGMKDLLTGIVDVDAENRAINEEMRPLIEQYKTASPEGQAAIEGEIGRISKNVAQNLQGKLLQHGIMLTTGMLEMTIKAPFNTVARGIRVLDSTSQTMIGVKDAEELKQEWFKSLDNIVPIAMDALVVMGGIKVMREGGPKALQGLTPKIKETAAVAGESVAEGMKFVKPEDRPVGVDTAFKGAGKEAVPEVDSMSVKMTNKEMRKKLIEEKTQLHEQYKTLSETGRKETVGQAGLTKDLGKADIQTELSKGESGKLIEQRKAVQADYDAFKNERVKAVEKYNAIKDKINYDVNESAKYKKDLEGHIKETETDIKTAKTPENKVAFTKKLEFLKDELADVKATDRLADVVYRADYMDRQYQGRLKAIDALIRPRIEQIEGATAAVKGKLVGDMKDTWAGRKQAVIARIAEINTELKNTGKGKAPAGQPALKSDTKTSLTPTQNATVKPGIESTADLMKAPKAEPKPEPQSVGAAAAGDPAFSGDTLPKSTGEAMKAKGINNIPETGGMRQIIKDIVAQKISMPGIFKKVKDMNIQEYILKHIDPSKITGQLSDILDFFRETKIPEIAALSDGIEIAGAKLSYKIPEWLGKYRVELKRSGITPEKFFDDYQAGKYDRVIDAVENKTAIDLKSLTPDELVAMRIKEYTNFFADIFELKEKTGEHGKSLFRKRYLPHIVLKEIADVLREGKRKLTDKETILYETITGHKFKNVFEMSRFKDLPHLKDPFKALEVYGEMAVKKTQHDTYLKVVEDTQKSITTLKNKAHTELEELSAKEEGLKTQLDKAEGPEAQQALIDEIGKIDKYRMEHPQLNEMGMGELLNRLKDVKDRVLEQSTFEDKKFMAAVNSKNPIATFVLEAYLKTPFIKKPIEIKNARVVDGGPGRAIIRGLIKDVDSGVWASKDFTLREFLGKRPVTRMLTNYKALSYGSILGLSIPSMITNMTQPLLILASMPGNKILPFLPSVSTVKAFGVALANVVRSIADPALRKKYQRANIFLTMDRLYDGVNFKEGIFNNLMDKLMVTMKVSELFNRAFSFELAQSVLKDKMKTLKPSQQITPIEIRRMAADLSDTFNFKYTPLHTEQLLSTNTGKLAFHFGSFFVKQSKLVAGMMKKEWQDPAVRKFYNVMKRGEDTKAWLNKANNESRMAVVRWVVLSTSLLVTSKALFDVWLWQVDPRRQMFFNPLENPLVQAPFQLLAGALDMIPGPASNPNRGLSKITNTIGKFVPAMSQFKRVKTALEEGAPEKIVFSSVAFKDAPPIQ